ncbi:MAG: glycoside hydrolase family 73 protein [Ignavibacteriaceae bacterium]
MKSKEFFKKYAEYAIANEEATGVPYLVCLAQAALESAWGSKAPENNFFGIKAGKHWKGSTQILRTKEFINGQMVSVKDYFRAYDTPLECFQDYADLLKRRFTKAFNYGEPESFIHSVQHEHPYKYATDPKYAQKIIVIIHKLREYEDA